MVASKNAAVHIQDYEFADNLGDVEREYFPEEIKIKHESDLKAIERKYSVGEIIEVKRVKELKKVYHLLTGLKMAEISVGDSIGKLKYKGALEQIELLGRMRRDVDDRFSKAVEKTTGIKNTEYEYLFKWNSYTIEIKAIL